MPAKPASGMDAYRRQQQAQPHAHQPPPTQPPPGRPAADSRWAAKVPRLAQDAHVHSNRQQSSAEDELAAGGGSSEEEGEQGQGRGIPGFQTAKTKLIAEMRQRGQQYNPNQFSGGAPPRQGLARPAGGARPAGLRKTGGCAFIGGVSCQLGTTGTSCLCPMPDQSHPLPALASSVLQAAQAVAPHRAAASLCPHTCARR